MLDKHKRAIARPVDLLPLWSLCMYIHTYLCASVIPNI